MPDWMTSLPPDILQTVLDSFLNQQETAHLAGTNSTFHYLFQPRATIKKLLTHVVQGEPDQVKIMLERNPSLLLQKGLTQDYSERIIHGTPYQIALGAMDEEMAMIIREYLQHLPNGKAEIIHQQEEQFPPEEKWDSSSLFNALNEIFDYIHTAPNEEIKAEKFNNGFCLHLSKTCEEKLKKFRNALRPSCTLTKGYHFDTDLFLAAWNAYTERYTTLCYENLAKNILIAYQVIGYIERLFPANLAQAFCCGLNKAISEKIKNYPQQRSLKLQDKNAVFFPLDKDMNFRLGFEYCVGWSLKLPHREWSEMMLPTLFSKLILIKKTKLKELLQQFPSLTF